jgi:NAD(P)-dependent dehydrogenase (short-subunit alcohol dehydrogenase family)
MTGRREGQVAFVTGAARDQGRSQAIQLAVEGAYVIVAPLNATGQRFPGKALRRLDVHRHWPRRRYQGTALLLAGKSHPRDAVTLPAPADPSLALHRPRA